MKKIVVTILSCLVLFLAIIPIKSEAEDSTKKIILIDPGHGGIDGGAKSKNGTIEKDINLQISLKLKSKLECKGYKVFMTRDEDGGLYQNGKTVREKKIEDLKNRRKMKSEVGCDMFISIHQNMFPQSKCFGAQVWYANNDNSSKAATCIQDSLKEIVKDNNKRVAKPAGDAYMILRDQLDVASILVECGFLSNPDEEARLKSEDHQNSIVEGISLGVDKYFNLKN